MNSQIDILIKELCPEGVPKAKLGEIANISIGEFVHKDKQNDSFEYPVYNGGTTNTGFYDKYNRTANKIIISARGSAGFVNKVECNYWAGNSVYTIDVYEKDAVWHYVYHYLKNYQEELIASQQKGGGVPAVSKKQVENIEIPLPPLDVQKEIVRILDKFSAIVENLDKELDLRQKQYEYYREKLLTFEEGECEWKKLGELFDFKNGLNKGKEYFGKGKPIIMFSTVFNNTFIDSSMVNNFVDITEAELSRINAKKGDVFFTRTSETAEDVGMAAVLLENIDYCTYAGFLIRARPKTNLLQSKYCKYCFSSEKVHNTIVAASSFTTRASLTGSGLANVSIPVPPLARQQEIVDTLDKFEAMIANLKEERTLRQKQYEYYREKLLTFN